MLNLGLGMVFSARDLASGTMGRVERRFRSLDDRVTGGGARIDAAFRRMGAGLAVFTAGAATIGAGVALAAAAGRFEQGIAAVGAVSRATATELTMLRDAAIQAGVNTQFSPDEAVQGLTALATAGQRANAATQTLIPVLDLAAGSMGQLGVEGADTALVGTLNAYSLGADEAAGVTDRLLRITQLTNFQSRDFEVGLSRAAATGAQYGQSIDDVLLGLGLLRNANFQASTSATALRESIRRLGSQRGAQRALAGLVDIFDQDTGRMRSIIDIMQDFGTATADMSEQQRNLIRNQAFGTRGADAFGAVMNASFETMRNGRSVTLRGAEAIAAMRQELEQSGGSAAEFREQLQNTFAGQATLLRGTLETLAVVIGEPFAEVFRPVLATVVELLNGLLEAIRGVPAPIRRAFAALSVVVGGILAAVGGALAAEAAIALFAVGFEALGVSISGILAPLAGAAVAIALVGGLVAGFAVAFRQNLGGLGDFVTRIGDRISLFFRGLGQLFEQGGFSGAVREELNQAENAGVRQFLVSLFQLAFRAQRLWEGFTQGFSEGLAEAEPVFRELRIAFEELGDELSSVFGDLLGGANELPSSEFVSFGARVGRALSSVIVWFAETLRIAAQFTRGVVQGARRTWEATRPALNALWEALVGLGTAFGELISVFQGGEESGQSVSVSWSSLGEVISSVGGGVIFVVTAFRNIVNAATVVVRIVSRVAGAFRAVLGVVLSVAVAIGRFFDQTIPSAAGRAVGAIRRAISGIREAVGPVARLLGIDTTEGSSSGRARATPTVRATGSSELIPGASEAARAIPSVIEARNRSGDTTRFDAVLRALEANTNRARPIPIQVALQVDGETLAEVTHEASRDVAARSFSPVPSF